MSTIKVLIADDEYWAVERLRAMVDWADLGMALLAPAADGEQALRSVARDRPDLLIADINMPFMDGLKLTRSVRERFPDTVCVLLTGFEDFEYVREALRIGVLDYLLKPVGPDELTRTLRHAAELIRREDAAQAPPGGGLAEDLSLSRLLTEDADWAADPTERMLGYYLAVLRMERSAMPDPFLSADAVKASLMRIAGDGGLALHNVFSPWEFVLLADMSRSRLSPLLLGCGWPCGAGVSQYTFAPLSIRKAYREALYALSMRACGRGQVWYEDVQAERFAERISEAQEAQLADYLARRLRDRAEQLILDEVGLARFDALGWRQAEVRRTLERVMTALLKGTRSKNAQALTEIEYLEEALMRRAEAFDAPGVAELLRDWLTLCVPAAAVPPGASAREIARHIMGVIRADPAQDFSLSELARRYGVESTYLSRLIRRETGDTLMQYIAKARIERACKALTTQPDVPIVEIAARAGYPDYAYFGRVFRKIMGVSPSQYRGQEARL